MGEERGGGFGGGVGDVGAVRETPGDEGGGGAELVDEIFGVVGVGTGSGGVSGGGWLVGERFS